jgi:hypothetical protein
MLCYLKFLITADKNINLDFTASCIKHKTILRKCVMHEHHTYMRYFPNKTVTVSDESTHCMQSLVSSFLSPMKFTLIRRVCTLFVATPSLIVFKRPFLCIAC